MKKNTILIYISAFLSILIPVPGRLGYGIVILLLLNVLSFSGTIFNFFSKKFLSPQLHKISLLLFLMLITLLYKQILLLFSPIIALTLSFLIFLVCLSSFLTGMLLEDSGPTIEEQLKTTMTKSGFFSLFSFLFFLIRDFLSYGTITWPSPSGLYVMKIFNSELLSGSSFWATIPGAFVLLGLVVALFNLIEKKITIVKRSER